VHIVRSHHIVGRQLVQRTVMGRRAMLLEFNEALDIRAHFRANKRLNDVCGAIALWFQRL